MNLVETWKIYPHNDNYEVSNTGRVRRARGLPREYKRGTLLKPCPDKDGYLQVALCRDGKPKTTKVHRLVLETFVGDCPGGMECNHKDGIKANNKLNNIEWITHGKNILHSRENGLLIRGEKHYRTKLTAKDIRKIRRLYRSGRRLKDLNEEFGVTFQHISKIILGKSWKHIKMEV